MLLQKFKLNKGKNIMTKDKVYQVISLVGTSQNSIEDAIDNALAVAGKKSNKVDWFEVRCIKKT